ncbi:MAG: 2OG-Fe(II) oxygenase [Geminicoccaceae bacterium]
MQRHGFGQGEYKYFADPLPEPVQRLRAGLYPPLAAIADRWEERLGSARRFPPDHAALRELCRAHGQTRPTPLVLKYAAGDYNCLHQDVYGPACFPLQVVILLSDPATFAGGELVLVEQRPRQQSRAEVVPMAPGRGVVFAVDQRPRQGRSGTHRVRQRHGVSRIHEGERMTLGIIFHDAA